MKSILFTLAFCTTIFLISFKCDILKNSFKIGSNEYSINSSLIANESYGTKSKFEVDLLNQDDRLDKPKTLVWFSATSNCTYKLSDGMYKFSMSSLAERLPFHFNGSVIINKHEVSIKDGSLSIETTGTNLEIYFILKLANGDLVKGSHSGNPSQVNRDKSYK